MEAGRTFNWTNEQENYFRDLKSALMGDEVLAYPKSEGLFIVDTDASDRGIGGCLSQLQWC